MIDTHAHVHDAKFDEDRQAMLARAKAAGIERIVTVGTDIADSTRAVATAREFGLLAAVGIHPHEAEAAPEHLEQAFAELLDAQNPVVAIGEIGLDYYYEHSPREAQQSLLRAQLELAGRRNLPVIFHERDALDDFTVILREETARRDRSGLPKLRGVIHCFTRDLAAAEIYTREFGLMLGIGGVLTFKTAEGLRQAVQAIGVDALILETDCPYLAPVPHRGKRNEPAMMLQSAELLASLLELSLDETIARTTANAKRLFGM